MVSDLCTKACYLPSRINLSHSSGGYTLPNQPNC